MCVKFYPTRRRFVLVIEEYSRGLFSVMLMRPYFSLKPHANVIKIFWKVKNIYATTVNATAKS